MNVLPSRLTPLFLLSLLCLLTACGGGSKAAAAPDPDPDPDPDPIPAVLTVLDVFPKNLSARAGSTIRFIAETSQQASSYAWDFGGGAAPSTSTDFQPLVVLGAQGTYTGSLIVCAAECATPFEFTYIVDPNANSSPDVRIFEITPTGLIGARGQDVTMQASVQGEVDTWLWEFGDGPTIPWTSEQSPTIHLLRPGFYEGHLTARLSGGGEDSLVFAYQIAEGIAEEPPFVEEVRASAPWICDNKSAAFEADILSDFPITYEWAMPNGIALQITTNSIARFTTPHLPGTYTIELRARNAFGLSEPVQQTFEVGECPDTSAVLVADPELPLGVLRIERTTIGEVHKNNRFFVDPVTFPVLYHDYPDGTSYFTLDPVDEPVTATFSASRFSQWGVGDYGPVTVPAGHGLQLPPVQQVFNDPMANGHTGEPTTLGLRGDRIVLVYKEDGSTRLFYCESLNADPQSSADWSSHELPAADFPINYSDAIRWSPGDGRPFVYILGDEAGQDYLAVAQVEQPQGPSDWHLIGLLKKEAHRDSRMACIRPMGELVLVEKVDEETLRVRIGTNAHPQAANEFVELNLGVLVIAGTGYKTSTPVDWNGQLLLPIAYQSPPLGAVLAATTTSPATASDFTFTPFPPLTEHVPSNLTTRSWLISKPDTLIFMVGNDRLNVQGFIANKALPQTISDWDAITMPKLFPRPAWGGLVGVHDNRWVLVDLLGDPDTPMIWRAMTPRPISPQDWRAAPIHTEAEDFYRPYMQAQLVSSYSNRLYFTDPREPELQGLRVMSVPLEW